MLTTSFSSQYPSLKILSHSVNPLDISLFPLRMIALPLTVALFTFQHPSSTTTHLCSCKEASKVFFEAKTKYTHTPFSIEFTALTFIPSDDDITYPSKNVSEVRFQQITVDLPFPWERQLNPCINECKKYNQPHHLIKQIIETDVLLFAKHSLCSRSFIKFGALGLFSPILSLESLFYLIFQFTWYYNTEYSSIPEVEDPFKIPLETLKTFLPCIKTQTALFLQPTAAMEIKAASLDSTNPDSSDFNAYTFIPLFWNTVVKNYGLTKSLNLLFDIISKLKVNNE